MPQAYARISCCDRRSEFLRGAGFQILGITHTGPQIRARSDAATRLVNERIHQVRVGAFHLGYTSGPANRGRRAT
jgi:hypothetical protein